MRIARQIDNHNWRVEELVRRIQECDHPHARAIWEELSSDCMAIVSAQDVVGGFLGDIDWEAKHPEDRCRATLP